MKSDRILVTSKGAGVAAAMKQAAAAAAYRDLNKKETLRLCLLAEEMLGMLREITGETEAGFWVESENKRFSLHLTAHPVITAAMRTELLSVSTSWKNDAAVGFMGKLRDIMERAFDAAERIRHFDRAGMLKNIMQGDMDGVCRRIDNVFEQFIDVPERVVIKGVLRRHFAQSACMSGSGPSVFGIFENEADAEAAAGELRRSFKHVYVCDCVDRGCEIV